jgi:hypothetical protein
LLAVSRFRTPASKAENGFADEAIVSSLAGNETIDRKAPRIFPQNGHPFCDQNALKPLIVRILLR